MIRKKNKLFLKPTPTPPINAIKLREKSRSRYAQSAISNYLRDTVNILNNEFNERQSDREELIRFFKKKLFDFLRDPQKTTLYKRSSKDFIRSSPLSFEVVVGSILHLFKESVEFNLQNLLPEMGIRPVTGSAFTQARYKIKPELFCRLLEFLNDSYKSSVKKLWKGHLLLAGDGSTLNLPSSAEIEDHFGIYATTQLGVKRYLARTLLIYDVLNNFVVDGQISTMNKGEKNASARRPTQNQ